MRTGDSPPVLLGEIDDDEAAPNLNARLLADEHPKQPARRGHDQEQARVLYASVTAALIGMLVILIGSYIKDPTGACALIGGIACVLAILSATTADLDVNVFFSRKRGIFVGVLLMALLATLFMSLVWTPMGWVMLLPLLYAVWRFKPIVNLVPGAAA
jgi:hypothetical protein